MKFGLKCMNSEKYFETIVGVVAETLILMGHS